ncbi:tetratricopeptide repeat protein [Lacinutrix gracilariae]|uniref:Tetratricopeptide repeat protein n=1 Tax=Lacinutrix gracilariae TaxID=1747198 RepID=A0ABW5K3Y6_9FLAO
MKIKLTYSFALLLLFVKTASFANTIESYTQQIDSLLEDSKNRIYETPDKSIVLGLSAYEDTNNSIKTRTRALMLVSLAYTSKRDYQKALEYIEKAEQLSIDLEDKRLQIEILFMTGILYQQLKIFDKSIEFLEKTEQQSLIYPHRDSVGKYLANSYIVKGFIYKDNLNCDIALEFFNKGIREYEKLKGENHRANLSIVYYNKGNCYTLLSEYGNAKNSFNRSIAFAKLEDASSLISFAQKGLAEVYTLEGQYDEAVSLLKTALNQSENVGDLVLNLGIYKGLFENYLALDNWEEYQKYYDLYLKVQLDIKKSERNSISDSINKSSTSQKKELEALNKQFKNRVKWIIVFGVLAVIILFFIHRKDKKYIYLLQKKVESIQNIKPTL